MPLNHLFCSLLTLGSRVSADTQPVDSTEKMKSFRITFSEMCSRFSGKRIHSRHILSSHLYSSSLRAVQISLHCECVLSINVLNIKHSHRTNGADAFSCLSYHLMRECNLRTHPICSCANRRPFRMSFTYTLGGIALKINTLVLSTHHQTYLTWSQLDQNNVIIHQTQFALLNFLLFPHRMKFKTLRIHGKIFSLWVAR